MIGIRLNILVEGQTEEAFVKLLLREHLGHSVWIAARMIQPGKSASRIHKGGLLRYKQLRRDLSNWMREDGGRDVRFTTMMDLYGYPRMHRDSTQQPNYSLAKELHILNGQSRMTLETIDYSLICNFTNLSQSCSPISSRGRGRFLRTSIARSGNSPSRLESSAMWN